MTAAYLAGASLFTAPAMAAELDIPKAKVAMAEAAGPVANEDYETVQDHRRYRYRYRRGPNAGDVLTGILILGTIGAVIDAAEDRSDRDRDERYRDRDWRDRDYRDEDYRSGGRYDERSRYKTRGLDRAIEMCVDAVERTARVASVEEAQRSGRGWEVEGRLANGGEFECEIDNTGRIRDIEIDRDGDEDRDSDDDRRGGYDSYEDGDDDRDYRGASYGGQTEWQLGSEGAQYDEGTYARIRSGQGRSQGRTQVGYEGGAQAQLRTPGLPRIERTAPAWDEPQTTPSADDGRYDISDVDDFPG
ncbi:hypothetical protein QQS45_09975 [Alteriqipengyuania flavescens]|uniref:hypothetical protein n=1 Tax=Alteriqipengyuania flavescens TaxID=3053610 RepID=UPI0025B5E59D|nr:hypothetical protein [Alteriqipengyuania flavescens]WJY17951.1 hypothetical protein QQW98_09970 [Alteriqipengyuania flavescens]WJY23892.1 hypothetical protein QQS45_09975 [Alteriqipengyuania flavescens]